MKTAFLRILSLCFVSVLPITASAQAPSEYRLVATIVTEPVFDGTSLAAAREAYTDGGVMSRKEYERQRLKDSRVVDGLIQAASEQIAEPLWKCYTTYQEIRRLDGNTPDFEGLAREAITASPGMIKRYNGDKLDRGDEQAINDLAGKALWEAGKFIYNSYSLSTERGNYATHYHSSRHKAFDAMAKAAQRIYGGSRLTSLVRQGGVTVLGISPSLANTYINDVIHLQNDSGKNLGLFRRICGCENWHLARLRLGRRVSPPTFTFAPPL